MVAPFVRWIGLEILHGTPERRQIDGARRPGVRGDLMGARQRTQRQGHGEQQAALRSEIRVLRVEALVERVRRYAVCPVEHVVAAAGDAVTAN